MTSEQVLLLLYMFFQYLDKNTLMLLSWKFEKVSLTNLLITRFFASFKLIPTNLHQPCKIIFCISCSVSKQTGYRNNVKTGRGLLRVTKMT